MLRVLRSDAVNRESPPGPEKDLQELATGALLDLILVSLVWDLIRVATLVPRSLNPRAALALVAIKGLVVELVPFLLLRRGLVQTAINTNLLRRCGGV